MCLAVLSGCAVQRSMEATRAKTELVGLTRAQLFNCAGVPARQASENGVEYLVYSAVGSSKISGMGQTFGNAALFSGRSNPRYCEATFTVMNGRVTRIMYSGKTGGLLSKDNACFPIIENCLR